MRLRKWCLVFRRWPEFQPAAANDQTVNVISVFCASLKTGGLPLKELFIASLLLCFPLGTLLVNAQDQVKPFTLEQVMSAPFPSGLLAAPVGGSVAWVQIAKGSRNIWVASPPEYKGRQVTSYSGDDGEEIG